MTLNHLYKFCTISLILLVPGSGGLGLVAQDLLGGADGGRDIEGGGSVAVLASFSQSRKKARRIEAKPVQVRKPVVALAHAQRPDPDPRPTPTPKPGAT